MELQALLLCFLATLAASAHGQSRAGFISIDCGLAVANYTESSTQIVYSSDAGYVDAGVNKNVASDELGKLGRRYMDLRSFPDGTRNCYTLRPVRRGGKYLVRAGFHYGNYDGLRLPPVFDLYLGVNLWTTVSMTDSSSSFLLEILAVAPAGSMQVCLVNKGTGTPFISVLELRPLLDSMYTLVTESQSLVLVGSRVDYGGDREIRFPDDPWDRIWFTNDYGTGWTPVSADPGVEIKKVEEFQVPSSVLRTAVTTASLAQSINFTVPATDGKKNYVFMHFAEIRPLRANQSRVFNVYANGSLWYHEPYSPPPYLDEGTLYTNYTGEGTAYTYSLTATGNSTLPPILNAREVYFLQNMSLLSTHDRDVNAILNIKVLYQVEKNWIGDPCAPTDFTWEGLKCDYDASAQLRIISLNLSFSGLTGEIPICIANLTALKTLDFSHNNFSGEIPEFLADLPVLFSLNLSSNRLTGSVPQALAKKSQDGSILLSLDDNPISCYKAGSCEVTKKKRKILLPIIIAASVLLIILILTYVIKRRRKPNALQSKSQELTMNQQREEGNTMNQLREEGNLQIKKHGYSLQKEGYQFTFLDIASITNNFQKPIGKGGFGSVYHGYLPDQIEVAVKMLSKWSSQGEKEFQAEAQVLTRVHHKNLVSLLGYCNDENNLALVYEFMPKGSLANHLSGSPDSNNGLSWSVRLKIAFEAAQGLDYLHDGCKPTIVHRDVKTANILLNQNFEVKWADFGLSKAFIREDVSHMTTVVAGTRGYLDPEYYRTDQLTKKSDVYSFGVVLLELITGQPPISNGSKKNHITEWVYSRIERGDINSIVDPRMQGDYNANSAWKMVEIAMACTSSPSLHRPTMSQVAMQLRECLTSEEANGFSHNFNMQSPNSIEVIPLNSGLMVSPPAR